VITVGKTQDREWGGPWSSPFHLTMNFLPRWQTAKTSIYEIFEPDWFTIVEKFETSGREVIEIFVRNETRSVATIYFDPQLARIVCEFTSRGECQTERFDLDVESNADVDLPMRLDQIKREYRPDLH
jgi:hypothetical protein